MEMLTLHLDGTGQWPAIEDRKLKMLGISRLPAGMQTGKSSVAVILEGPDGKMYACETSMNLFLMAARAFQTAEEMEQQVNMGKDGGWHD